MGELTAVASAKRGVRGDFSDGGLIDDALEDSLRGPVGRAAIVICLGRGLSDIASGWDVFRNVTT